MHLLKVFIVGLVPFTLSETPRRKLIVSSPERLLNHPSFVVSIQSIDRVTKNRKHICTGSIIKRRVVLTAAHCAHHLAASELVVVTGLGSASPEAAIDVFNVTGISHPGFRHQHFAPVNDLALLFLDRCISGITVFPMLASGRNSVERSCTQAKTYGFGRHEIIPPDLFIPDGSLRSLTRDQRFHSDPVCREAFTLYTLETLYKSLPVSETINTLIMDSINSNVGCYGGDQKARSKGYTCEGDSGGPVFDSDSDTLVGVTSFSSEICGTLPNYFTRIGPFSRWIFDELKKSSHKCDRDNDLEYLVQSKRKLEESKNSNHPLLNLITRAVTESCSITLLNEALSNPTVPTAEIQNLCTSFLSCLEDATATPAVDLTSALLAMFPSELEEIAEPMLTKQGISRILLCSSAYETFYDNWHAEADITFRYMEMPPAKNECKK